MGTTFPKTLLIRTFSLINLTASGLRSMEYTFAVATFLAMTIEKQPTPANMLTIVSLGSTKLDIRSLSPESLGEK